MLADPKAEALVNNFAEQWLFLRNVQSVSPDESTFPNFDDNLRQGYKRETELFFDSIVKEDRDVMDLLTANYTFVNERLAEEYGIPNMYGSQFRRVSLDRRRRARGIAGARQHLERDILSHAHVAGAARQVDHGKYHGHASSGASAECARVEGSGPRREGSFDPAVDGGAS